MSKIERLTSESNFIKMKWENEADKDNLKVKIYTVEVFDA